MEEGSRYYHRESIGLEKTRSTIMTREDEGSFDSFDNSSGSSRTKNLKTSTSTNNPNVPFSRGRSISANQSSSYGTRESEKELFEPLLLEEAVTDINGRNSDNYSKSTTNEFEYNNNNSTTSSLFLYGERIGLPPFLPLVLPNLNSLSSSTSKEKNNQSQSRNPNLSFPAPENRSRIQQHMQKFDGTGTEKKGSMDKNMNNMIHLNLSSHNKSLITTNNNNSEREMGIVGTGRAGGGSINCTSSTITQDTAPSTYSDCFTDDPLKQQQASGGTGSGAHHPILFNEVVVMKHHNSHNQNHPQNTNTSSGIATHHVRDTSLSTLSPLMNTDQILDSSLHHHNTNFHRSPQLPFHSHGGQHNHIDSYQQQQKPKQLLQSQKHSITGSQQHRRVNSWTPISVPVQQATAALNVSPKLSNNNKRYLHGHGQDHGHGQLSSSYHPPLPIPYLHSTSAGTTNTTKTATNFSNLPIAMRRGQSSPRPRSSPPSPSPVYTIQHQQPQQQQSQSRRLSLHNPLNIPSNNNNNNNSSSNRRPLYQQQQQRQAVSSSASSANNSLSSSAHNTASAPGSTPSSTSAVAPPVPSHRTAPDILKTLLRKKACLYEPDTSRSISLITWLVGRRMALKFGYFSRQQLQSGVHFCVSPKIDAQIITRTKVNRCMQIILNSCFHYIIPRPNGMEENGLAFRKVFKETVVLSEDEEEGQDETITERDLVRKLPKPWNDLNVSQSIDTWLAEQEQEQAHDLLSSSHHHHTTETTTTESNKRTVLLCFNENVKSSQDVYRCHDEFIRDAAHSGNLFLTADEWKQFFEGSVGSKTGDSSSSEPSSPLPAASTFGTSAGITMTPPSAAAVSRVVHQAHTAPSSPISTTGGQQHAHAVPLSPPSSFSRRGTTHLYQHQSIDELYGQFTKYELSKFRTTWCCKRYDHDFTRCVFAHTSTTPSTSSSSRSSHSGWLRRDPTKYTYSSESCPYIHDFSSQDHQGIKVNACPFGIHCEYSHSQEEVDYHLDRYKRKGLASICPSCTSSNKSGSTSASQQKSRSIAVHSTMHGGSGSGTWPTSSSALFNLSSCKLRDVCPFLHPHQHSKSTLHFSSKAPGSSSTTTNTATTTTSNDTINAAAYIPPPQSAPMLYIDPAPVSEFEKSLMLPGLQQLFRKRSATLFRHYLERREDS